MSKERLQHLAGILSEGYEEDRLHYTGKAEEQMFDSLRSVQERFANHDLSAEEYIREIGPLVDQVVKRFWSKPRPKRFS